MNLKSIKQCKKPQSIRALKDLEMESEYRSIIRAEGLEKEDVLSQKTESIPTLSMQITLGMEGMELWISFLFLVELEF